MPDYKKKRFGRSIPPPKKRGRETAKSDDIIMSSSDKRETEKSSMRIVKGKKLEQRRRLRALLTFTAGVVILCVILSLLLPVGIIESVGNLTAQFGPGSYPIELSGNETLNAIPHGGYYYVLTNSRINAISDSGKSIYSDVLGFENPILKTSATRALVFDQGGNAAFIYNLSKRTSSRQVDLTILTANISRCGTYAIVTQSPSYASTVSVYNKNDKLIYEWNSAEDIVNNVVLSPNGKKIAISLLNSSNGKYSSKVYVLDFNSATPIFKEEYTDTVVYTLDSTNNAGFSVVTANRHCFIKWSDYKRTEYTNEYEVSHFRAGSGRTLMVFSRASDRADNRVVVLSSSGNKEAEFNFSGIISDISLSGGHIYCISDTTVFLLDEQGKTIRKADCGFGGVRLAVLSTYTVAVITDHKIERIKLKSD